MIDRFKLPAIINPNIIGLGGGEGVQDRPCEANFSEGARVRIN